MNVNEDEKPFTNGTLQDYGNLIDTLYHSILFDTDSAGADPFAEQEFLLALGHLELAKRHMGLAKLHQVRAIAGN